MHYISEDAVRACVTQADINAVVSAGFAAMAAGDAVNFPVIRETLGYADAVFGFKSGFNRKDLALGVKAGGLWPANRARGLDNHQSTIALFDPETGAPRAFVRAGFLTALRTAAASAISIRHLARENAKRLGVIGAGGQAMPQIRAALAERPFQEIMVYDRVAKQAEALAKALKSEGLDVSVCNPEPLARKADVIITITPSLEPVVSADWVTPGAHLACMGADTKGKHEVDTALVANAVLFTDDPNQAAALGECQHACNAGEIEPGDIATIGAVINGERPGRTDEDQITLFDGTGVAAQDLAAADVALAAALRQGRAVRLD